MIDKLYTEAQRLVNDKIIAILKEQGPKVAFAQLYTLMPLPLRLLVKEDAFISFCMTHKDRLVGKAPAKKVAKKPATAKPAAKKVAVTKTMAKKPSTTKPAAKKPAAKTSVKKAAAKK